MSDTYGHTSALPLMRYDQRSLSWRTCEDTSLWDLEMSSPTFPESGMTQDGLLYERPTQALPTAGQGYSSLPTPAARDYKDQAFSPRVRDGRSHGELPEAIALQFLPTPTVMDMGSSYSPEEWEQWKQQQRDIHNNSNGHGASLSQELIGVSTNKQSDDGKLSRGKPQTRQSKEMEGQDSLLSLLNG